MTFTCELGLIVKDIKIRINQAVKKYKKAGKTQISLLKKNGNISDDWKKIYLIKNVDLSRIRNNYFSGEIYIGSNKGSVRIDQETELNSGIYNSTLQDCFVDKDVLIRDVKFLKNYYIGENAALINNGTIICQQRPVYGNGQMIPVGNETGGRDIYIYAELLLQEAVDMAMKRDNPRIMEDFSQFIKNYCKNLDLKQGVISPDCRVLNCSVITDTFLGPSCRIENILKIQNSTVLSSNEEITRIKDGVIIINSIVQWGVHVSSMAIIDSSIMMEHSEAERHAKVIHSVIGPNTGIAEGEINSALAGPFIGFHHQSLLIAALWPEGKGNIGYGANIGSNHTGKAADQEIYCGEGCFFGLSCNIKFPANYFQAPYSVISTGVTALPQKVRFPFSLINLPSENIDNISPAYNEITPGWVLSDNLYAVKRNESKYRKRNKAKRNKIIFEVFRQEIMEQILQARDRLKDIKEQKQVYTDQDITGLGKNYLLEKNRIQAIETYTFFLQYYCLRILFQMIRKNCSPGNVSWKLLDTVQNDPQWDFVRSLMAQEFPGNKDLNQLIEQYLRLEEEVFQKIKISKTKDDIRGQKVFDDYDRVHVLADEDSLITENRKELESIKKEIEEWARK